MPESISAGGHEQGPRFINLGDGLEGAVTDTGLKLSVFEDSKQVTLRMSADETRRLRDLLEQHDAELSELSAEASANTTQFKGSAEPGQHVRIVDYQLRGGSEIPTNRDALPEVNVGPPPPTANI